MRLLLFVIVTLMFLFACQNEDDYLTDGSVMLEFSADTLRFDTVFTQLGSATRQVRVKNTADQPILISRIFIDQENNFFRMNVDGISSNDVSDVEIPANDSIYIFVEVTIDPDNPLSVSPFVVTEHIRTFVNGNEQSFVVEAFGQNANYIPAPGAGGAISGFTCQFGEWVWDDPKPYVIYGILVVDSCTLRIPAGQQVYLHGGLATANIGDTAEINYNDGRLIIGSNGRLIVDGEADNEVVIQGDRLESGFDDVSGQWYGIVINKGGEADINHAIIKNSAFGLVVDSSATAELSSTQIFNTSNNGLTAVNATVNATNCLIYDNSGSAVRITQGGTYRFDYCTFASYGNRTAALVIDNVLCLDPEDPFCQEIQIFSANTTIRNSIIFGSQADEILLINRSDDASDFQYRFENSLVRIDDLPTIEGFENFFDLCDPCLTPTSSDPLFLDINEDDYRLDSMSVANDFAKPVMGVQVDILGINRDATTPDPGVFELKL